MVYQWKPLRTDQEAIELAQFLRGLIGDAGLTLREIADAAFLSRSALSQNCDGRWRQWNVIERWITALYDAAEALEVHMKISKESAMQLAEEHWKIADGRHREGRRHRRTSAPDSAANGIAPGTARRIPGQRPADLGRNGPAPLSTPSPGPPNQRRRPADNPVAVHRPGLENPAQVTDPRIWAVITGRNSPTPELISLAIDSCPAEDLPALVRIFTRIIHARVLRDLGPS